MNLGILMFTYRLWPGIFSTGVILLKCQIMSTADEIMLGNI
jgi:hypothetical protein